MGKASPVLFCHPQRSLKCLVHGDDFVVSGEPVDLVWMQNELEAKLEINTTILWDEPGMSKEVKIMNRKLCWHDGVGIPYEADQKQSSAKQGHSIWHLWKSPCPKRMRRMCEIKQMTMWRRGSWESCEWRNNRWSDRFWALPKPLGIEHWQQLPIFLPSTEETSWTAQKNWHVTWQHQQQQTGRRWWDWGGIWKTDQEFDCGRNFKERRVNLKRTQTQIGYVAEEHVAVLQEDTQLQDLISLECVQNTSCCGSQFSGSRIVRLSEIVGRNNGTHLDVERLRLTHEWIGTGDASASLAIVGRRGLGKLRHLDTNYLWIQEKAAKGDLNFKKVFGVDNGADLFTKSLSWNETQSHIHKLSSQFIQNDISVNYVGARPNGVNLPPILQEMGLAGRRNLAAWTRTDMSSRTRRTTTKSGLVWSDVVARVTADAINGEILDSALAREITRSLEHTPLEGGPRDIQTILVFKASKVKSPSTILQDSVRQGWVRVYGEYNSWNFRHFGSETFGERAVLESECEVPVVWVQVPLLLPWCSMSTAVGLSVSLDLLRNWSVSSIRCGECVIALVALWCAGKRLVFSFPCLVIALSIVTTSHALAQVKWLSALCRTRTRYIC